MQKVSFLVKALSLLFVLAAAAQSAAAFDGCLAADVSGSVGRVDFADISTISAAQGTVSPRLDLDGGGLVDSVDVLTAFGFVFRTCTGCTADFDGDLDVDEDDRAALEAAYGRECRLDMDRNGLVEDPNDLDIWVLYFQSHPSNPARPRADFDGNGTVNINDLFQLLPTIGNDCRFDLNKDGAVDTTDLWLLLASWGTCPAP